jgi:hypothetical protein
MGDYQDYCMRAAGGQTLDQAMGRCQARGGRVVRAQEEPGGDHRFCVIQYPAVAVAALLESRPERA